MSRIPKETDFEIPEERIALYPSAKRDNSRLLIYNSGQKKIVHVGRFSDITEFFENTLIVRNNTRVLPALVNGFKPGGGKVKVLFLIDEVQEDSNEIIVKALINPGRRLKPGLTISLPGNAVFWLESKSSDGKWTGRWSNREDCEFYSWLEESGNSPLPPYIRREPEESDRQRYQTVYATDSGSLAAPTAGLHFTEEVTEALLNRGCEFADITLDVGIGTFMPVRVDNLSEHSMHTETYRITSETADKINSCLTGQEDILTVGTTVVRALEDSGRRNLPILPGSRSADIFIYPPYNFSVVKKLLTNFHRSDSTLMQLIAALIGWDGVNLCYKTALDEDFRFFSYGDSMLII